MEIKNFGQLINHLALKAGIKADNQALKDLLSNPALSEITVHPDFVKNLDENLLTVDAAMDDNPKIKGKYTAEALGPFDRRMEALLDKLELEETEATSIKGIKSSYKRFEALAAKIEELKDQKKEASGSIDKTALQKKIDELQADLAKQKELLTAKDKEVAQNKAANDLETFLRRKFAGRKTIYDELDEDIRYSSLLPVLNKELQENNAELKYDENENLTVYMKDGSGKLFINNQYVDPEKLIDSAFAKKKVLKTSEPATPAQPGTPTNVPPTNNPAAYTGNKSIADFNRAQRNAFQKSTAVQGN